jgi:hypothetical protein
MISVENTEGRRTVEVWIVLQVPEGLSHLPKDVTLSIHSQSLAQDSRAVRVPCAVRVPWTNAVRLMGLEDIFVVRVKVPAHMPVYLHAVALIEEPPKIPNAPCRKRHIGFKNMALDATGSDADVLILVNHFETYTLYSSAFKKAA